MVGLLFELGCRGDTVGDVDPVQHDPANGGIVEKVGGAHLEMSVRTVAVRDPEFSRRSGGLFG